MRNKGMVVGATLMEHWLNNGANDQPERGVHDINTVRMNWVLSFGRAGAVFRRDVRNKVWMTERAKELLVRKLIRREGRLPSKVGEKYAQKIGNVGEGVTLHANNVLRFHEDWYIQTTQVKENPLKSPLDDLYAALGNFSFHYLMKGRVERLEDQGGKPRYRVTFEKVGVYVKDSYDFIDDLVGDGNPLNRVFSQPLGFWGCSPNSVAKHPFPLEARRNYVQNRDFREWRKRYGKGHGGDFLVFSNIKVFDVSDSFEF